MERDWTPIYNAFDPFVPVPVKRLPDWYVERPKSPVDDLLRNLEPARNSRRFLLVGHISSGKTSALVKLGASAFQKDQCFVVRVNAEQNAEVDKLNTLDILLMMGTAIYKVAKAELKAAPDARLYTVMVDGMRTLVTEHTETKEFALDPIQLLESTICYGATALFGPMVGAAVATGAGLLGAAFTLGYSTRAETVAKLERLPQAQDQVVRLNALIQDVQTKANRPLLLLVDGLDRIQQRAQVERVFKDNRHLASVDARVVYSAPLMVRYDPRFAPLRAYYEMAHLPNVKLYERGNPVSRDKDGYKMLRKVVDRRLVSLGLAPRAVIDRDALDVLVQGSSGLIRDLVRLMGLACGQAEKSGRSHVNVALAEEARKAARREYQYQVNARYRDELLKVWESHELTGTEDCDVLVYGNFIVSYVNDDIWYDPHALLLETLSKEAA